VGESKINFEVIITTECAFNLIGQNTDDKVNFPLL